MVRYIVYATIIICCLFFIKTAHNTMEYSDLLVERSLSCQQVIIVKEVVKEVVPLIPDWTDAPAIP